jgi:hypothetical protein
MFMYLAVAAQLLMGATAEHEDFVAALKMGENHAWSHKNLAKNAREYASANSHRYLRDAEKPDDFVMEFYLDENCEHRSAQTAVIHGNNCFKDDNGQEAFAAKMGCAVINDRVKVVYGNYGSPDENNGCANAPITTQTFNFPGDPRIAPIAPGECIPHENGQFAKVFCSGKDPVRDQKGLHELR